MFVCVFAPLERNIPNRTVDSSKPNYHKFIHSRVRHNCHIFSWITSTKTNDINLIGTDTSRVLLWFGYFVYIITLRDLSSINAISETIYHAKYSHPFKCIGTMQHHQHNKPIFSWSRCKNFLSISISYALLAIFILYKDAVQTKKSIILTHIIWIQQKLR